MGQRYAAFVRSSGMEEWLPGCGFLVATDIASEQYREMWDDDDAPSNRTSDADPFRGVFDFNPWADNRRDSETGLTWHPLGPIHVRRPLPDGSYELRPQIAHRLSWWLGGMRDRAGFTQTELGQRLGTTQAAIAKWETGRTLIGLDRLARFSDVTGFPVALYFDFGGSERGRAMWL